jgi:choline dehydrogenase-like flavoprotein
LLVLFEKALLSMNVTTKQHAALTALCDTFIPSIVKSNDQNDYWKTSASDLNTPQAIIDLLSGMKKEDQAQFEQLLQLISTPLLGLTWFGPLKGAQDLTPAQRQKMLLSWSGSSISDIRNIFGTLKKLCGIIQFGANDNHWQNIDYQLVNQNVAIENSPIRPLVLDKDTVLDCDVVIVGSGSGGGLVAAQLAAKGQKVIVVEKGIYLRDHEYTQRELQMINTLYEGKGLVTTKDGSVSILAGSTLGGGTTVNWAGALRTPDYVLEQWAKEHDNPHFLDPAYKKGFEFVEQRNHVTTDFGAHNPHNRLLRDTAQAKGYSVADIPMNLQKPEGVSDEVFWKAQGFSCVGDVHGIKQSNNKTFLRDAVAQGADILTQTHIEKITIKQGEAVGVEGFFTNAQNQRFQVTIKAKKVVVSAGSLHTPVLLMRSGLRHKEIGNNLFLHPVMPIPGIYKERIDAWYGPMMSVVVNQFANLDNGYGFRMECPPTHPGLLAVATPWESGEQYKNEALATPYNGVFFALVRDKFGGKIKISPQSKQPEIHYWFSDYDKKHFLQGAQEVVKLHAAAGAERVTLIRNQAEYFYPKKDNLDHFVQKIASLPWKPNQFGLFSAHQMGTCRMGGNANSPVKPNGETREVKNLFVADASLFPAASGTNPMLSVQALAYYVAGEMG